MKRCDFCGEFHVSHLVKGQGASICSDCIGIARGAIWRKRLLDLCTPAHLIGAMFLGVVALGGFL